MSLISTHIINIVVCKMSFGKGSIRLGVVKDRLTGIYDYTMMVTKHGNQLLIATMGSLSPQILRALPPSVSFESNFAGNFCKFVLLILK